MKISIIAGGAGFISYTLISELINRGRHIAVIDNLSRGKIDYINNYIKSGYVTFFDADLSIRNSCTDVFSKISQLGEICDVWHLAANSDIPAGVADLDVDLKDTFITTVEILTSMKKFGVKNLYFASSSAVYGDLGDIPLTEDIGPLLPISNYGAMKLASEAAISAASEAFLERVVIFRFPNVVGIPATHGVIFDFINKLIFNSSSLSVLGNGSQQKSYLHVSDLVSAMLIFFDNKHESKLELINIGPVDFGVTVRWIAERVVARISPQTKIIFGSENRGWLGDVPKFNYSIAKLQSYGWSPSMNSEQSILRAIDEIADQLKVYKV